MNDEPEIEVVFEPQPELVISDVESLKALSDQRRLLVLELLAAAPHTAKELAAVLKLPPNKLYYHLKLLEDSGLIRVVRTRIVWGIIEKAYRAQAQAIRIDRSLLAVGTPDGTTDVGGLMDTVFDATRQNFQAARKAGLTAPRPGAALPDQAKIGRANVQLTEAQFRIFYERVEGLLGQFSTQTSDEATTEYELFVALFPRAPQTDRAPNAPGSAAESGASALDDEEKVS